MNPPPPISTLFPYTTLFRSARLGIVTPAFLLQKSKWAIVLSFVIAAILTPSPDMVNQSLLALPMIARSEEHTSELQSRFDLVCRLLLEKKKDIYLLVTYSYF